MVLVFLFLISFIMIISRSIHVAANSIISSFLCLSNVESYIKESIQGYSFAYSIFPCLAKCIDFKGRVAKNRELALPVWGYKKALYSRFYKTLVEWFLAHKVRILCLAFKTPLHFLCVCSLLQSCPTLCDPLNCSPPGSSVNKILQARILEWVAITSSRGSS